MSSGGEILIDGLIGYGSTHIFCVPGESYLPALDALYDEQERHYPDRVSGTDLRNPDFVSLARAYGAYTERVDKTDQFEQAFENTLGPICLR